MPRRLWRYQDTRWIRRLLPACDNDISLAKRQLTWLKEKTNNPRLLDQHVHDRVVRHKPLQYILGTQPFGELDIVTRPPILIPRWETEEWVHRLIDKIIPYKKGDEPFRILDICTGSGCIALFLATHLSHCNILATDISKEAIALSKENYRENISKIQGPTATAINTVEFKQVDVFAHDALEKMMLQGNKGFDLIVSNPPYITFDEYKDLDPDVKQWEDSRALVAEEQGTAVHRRIVELASQGLLCKQEEENEEKDGFEKAMIPRLVMEFGGTHQVEPLKRMMMDKKLFQEIQVWKDLAGKDRVIVGI